VLPFRCNSKLLFCLCRTCAIEQNTNVCTHETVAERALIGSWVIDEIRLEVQKVYRFINVFEVYEYKVTQDDPTTGQCRLFVEYINTFLKLKAEASGYPSWVRTPEVEDNYINMFKASRSILLDRRNSSQRCQTRAGKTVFNPSVWNDERCSS